jgi:hypothetical protein
LFYHWFFAGCADFTGADAVQVTTLPPRFSSNAALPVRLVIHRSRLGKHTRLTTHVFCRGVIAQGLVSTKQMMVQLFDVLTAERGFEDGEIQPWP